ncbi:sensor histidine kinase [Lysobacteraceae bacterium NML120232]|nr:sensor histidine kinase [Xanthomonadaceae bacterium NML08-0793]PJK13771.1 sensor histidine kinase [Xanthomonadaceae bacterium NML120232]
MVCFGSGHSPPFLFGWESSLKLSSIICEADQRPLRPPHRRYAAAMPKEAFSPATSPLPLLWHPQSILLSMLLAETVAIILSLSPGLAMEPLIYLGLMSVLLQWITVSTLLLSRAIMPWLLKLSASRLLAVLVLLLTLSAVLMSALAKALFPGVLLPDEGIARLGWLQIPALVLILGTLGAFAFHRHWESKLLAIRAKQAELDALRARVDPHFLFNSLNTAVALVHTQPDEAEQVLLDLSDLFRAALSGNELHPLKREIELTQRYLEIERLRLGERLRVSWRLPPTLPHRQIPALTLQTLVENAVRHGIEKMPGGGKIEISVLLDAYKLRLRVSNAIPLRTNGPTTAGHKVGIAATKARVEAISEGQGGLLTFIENGEYVSEIVLPYRTQ